MAFVTFQTGQTGIVLLLESNNSNLNLTGWTGSVLIKRPNGQIVPGAGSVTPTSDGTAMQYTVASSDFPVGQSGTYTIELHVTNNGVTLKSQDQITLVDSLA